MLLSKFCSFLFLHRGHLAFFAVCGVIIAELLAGAFVHLSRAPQLRKFGNLSIQENLAVTSEYDLLSAQTLGDAEGCRESSCRGRSMS